jgi:hypothetical protein
MNRRIEVVYWIIHLYSNFFFHSLYRKEKRFPMSMATPASSRNVSRTPYQQIQVPTKDPRAMELYQQVAQALGPHLGNAVQGIGQLAGGGTPEQWQQLEAPALRQYQQLVGGIGARYSGLGSGGAQKSSAFQNELSGSAADLAERLQGQRMGLQQNALQQLLGLYQNLIGTDTFENVFLPKQKPWWQEFASAIAPGIGMAGGNFSSMAGLMKLFPQMMRGG